MTEAKLTIRNKVGVVIVAGHRAGAMTRMVLPLGIFFPADY